MPILSGCCFCLDLKVGTKIIGVLNLIGGLMNSISCAIFLVMIALLGLADNIHDTVKDSIRTTPEPSIDDDYIQIGGEEESPLDLFKENIGTVKLVLFVMLGMMILHVIISSMLIHGVRKNRRGLLVPYMVQEVVLMLLMLALGIGVLSYFGTHKIFLSFSGSLLLGIIIHLYFLLVVISQYQALGLIRMHEEISMK